MTSGDRVVVTSGLNEGQTIVSDGADKLRDGATVTTVQAPPPERTRQRGDGKTGDGKGSAPATSAATSAPAASSLGPAAAANGDAPKSPGLLSAMSKRRASRKQRKRRVAAPGNTPPAARRPVAGDRHGW